MNLKVTGVRERMNALDGFARGYQTAVRKELINYGQKMTREARGNHEFTPRSGSLDRSIDADVPMDRMSMDFGIVGGLSDVTHKGRTVSYGVFQHEGTYSGYRKSKAAKSYQPSTPKTGFGILADHFIVRAWDNNIKEMVTELRRTVVNLAKRATGEK